MGSRGSLRLTIGLTVLLLCDIGSVSSLRKQFVVQPDKQAGGLRVVCNAKGYRIRWRCTDAGRCCSFAEPGRPATFQGSLSSTFYLAQKAFRAGPTALQWCNAL